LSGLRPGNRHVLLLWAASAGSQGASWIVLVAVFVYVLHHYPASSLAIVELVGTLPALLCMPFAGAMADRHDVRRLALGSMAVQALGLLGVLVLLRVGLWEVAACYGLQGAASAVWPPARQRWLYALVREEHGRTAANAAIGSVSGVMTIGGAALAGVLSAWSTTAALAVAAGLQLAATVPLLALARPAFQQGAQAGVAPLRSLRADLAEGFTALRALPLARSVIWVGISWGLIGGAYNVLLAAYVTNDLHGGGLLLGVFYVVDGAAVILGSMLAVRLRLGSHLAAYALAYVLQGAAWGAMFLGDWPAWGVALLAVMHTASGLIIALDTTILLVTVPQRLRGRITSLHITTYSAASRVALAAFAALLAVTGVRTVGVLSGAASVIVGAAWWWLNGRRARPFYMSATSVYMNATATDGAPGNPGTVPSQTEGGKTCRPSGSSYTQTAKVECMRPWQEFSQPQIGTPKLSCRLSKGKNPTMD
jgi:MFS family permease